MENNKVYTIYVIKHDSVPCYIGVTSMTLKERFKCHCNNMCESHVMGPIIKEKGKEHFSIESLIQYFDKNAAYNAEAELTEIYRENYNLYNRNTGAKLSAEAKQKIRDTRLGKKLSEETKRKISESNLGKQHSEESKQKIRDSRLGKKLSEKTKQKLREAKPKKKVFCVELNRTFESINATARELNINHGNISHCCLGKRQTAGSYHFQFVS